MKLELSDQEVSALIQILTNTTGSPWVITHPLIMKIGQQQQAQAQAQEAQPQAEPVGRKGGNSHDRSDLDEERGGSVRAAGRGAPAA